MSWVLLGAALFCLLSYVGTLVVAHGAMKSQAGRIDKVSVSLWPVWVGVIAFVIAMVLR